MSEHPFVLMTGLLCAALHLQTNLLEAEKPNLYCKEEERRSSLVFSCFDANLEQSYICLQKASSTRVMS